MGGRKESFGDLQNYTTLKHWNDALTSQLSFGDLQNYTTLKHYTMLILLDIGFGDLQNYTTLKPVGMVRRVVFRFWRFTELHYSQTHRGLLILHNEFWRFTELHYSQT